MTDEKRMLIIATHGAEDPEKATIPFVMGTTAQASGIKVKIGFQADAVMLAKKDCLPHIFAPNFPPLEELVNIFIEAGGEILLCGPCVKSRKLDKADFIKGTIIVNAPTLVNESMNAKTLVY
ncbi:DsrE family protein [candidate division WOR-3 bacterium]|nr:DsrE family protein [candidate division WOR-3 bacterium]